MNGVSEAVRARIAAARAPSREIGAKWRAGSEMRALEALFADCPLDCPEPAARHAEQLLGDSGWVEGLLAPLVAALAGEPFFEPPFRASRDRLRNGAVLFECPAASLSASVMDARAPAGETIIFTGRVTVTRYVRAGGATLRRWRAEPLAAEFCAGDAGRCEEIAPRALVDGAVQRCDGRTQAQLPGGAASDVVTLAVVARAGTPLMREYRIADGNLVRVASADERASRTEMLLAYLRLAGRTDAGARFEAATRDAAFHLRWAAMREWLALDARAALPRLGEMAAGDPHSEVRAAALRMLPIVEARCRG
jgi:hypothetical protein